MSVLIKYEKHVRKVDCNSSFPSSSVLQGRGNLTAAVGKNAKTAIRGAITGQWCIHERGQLGFICNYVSNGWFVVFGWPPLFRLKCKPEKRNKKKNLSTLLVHWLCNLSRFLFVPSSSRQTTLVAFRLIRPSFICVSRISFLPSNPFTDSRKIFGFFSSFRTSGVILEVEVANKLCLYLRPFFSYTVIVARKIKMEKL